MRAVQTRQEPGICLLPQLVSGWSKEFNTEKKRGWFMMPLTMAGAGEKNTILKITGKEETRKFLENLGFVTGSTVTVVSEADGNLIVNVKDSRVALGKDMANRIMV